jgi:hypothetical protein
MAALQRIAGNPEPNDSDLLEEPSPASRWRQQAALMATALDLALMTEE